jgi:hypothetical protein
MATQAHSPNGSNLAFLTLSKRNMCVKSPRINIFPWSESLTFAPFLLQKAQVNRSWSLQKRSRRWKLVRVLSLYADLGFIRNEKLTWPAKPWLTSSNFAPVSIAYTGSNGLSIDVQHFSGTKNVQSKKSLGSNVPVWPNKEQIKDATVALLRRLIVLTQTLEPLPQQRDLVMRLTYYPDVTPQDYTPSFFTSTLVRNEEEQHGPNHVQIGSVTTPFHSLSFSYVSLDT